jgi:signal transduction histidine kinase
MADGGVLDPERARRFDSLGLLAGGIAHDVNNLLSVILNFAAFIAEEAGNPDADPAAMARDAEQILRAAHRGRELTGQLLAFAGREAVAPRPLDVNELIGDLERILDRLLDGRVTLTVQPGVALPLVHIDPGRLEQVLVNLAANAYDAMPDGGTMLVDTAHVFTGETGAHVRIRVSDTGVGMSPEVADRAFEPFFTTKHSGTGLGLAVAYGIVTQAGGRLDLDSAPGVGTTVHVLLPVAFTA